MKESRFIENVKQVSTVKDLKAVLEKYPDETELVAEAKQAITELYVGTTHPVGDRDTEEEIILIFGGNNNE